jgi:SpoIIAA-like
MIQTLNEFPAKVLAFACKGHVTKSDYETVLIPAVEKALKQPGKVRLYYQIDPDFSSIDAGAMWDDFKVGVEHILRWERIAAVTDVDWMRNTIGVFGFLMPGAVRVFRLNESAKAREWISEGIQ